MIGNTNPRKAGVVLSYVNLIIGTIVPFFYTPIMLDILGQAEYGLYSLSTSIINYLSLLQFGMGSAVIRYVTKNKATNDKEAVEKISGLFTLIYIFLAALVIIVGLVLSGISDKLFAQGLTVTEIDKLKILIIVMSINTACSFVSGVFTAIINAYERFIFIKTISIFQTILAPVINLIVLFIGYKSVGIAIASLLLQLIYFPLYIIYVTKRLSIKPKFSKPPKSLLKELWIFSGFMFISTIADLLFWSTDNVLIGALIGSTEVAVYNIGGIFTSIMRNLTSAISGVFVPKVTEMVTLKESNEEVSNLLVRIGRIQFLIVSLIISGFIVFGQVFIHFWSGDEYLDAYFVSLVTMIPLAVPILQNIAFGVILAQNKHKFRSIIYCVIAVINAITTFLVIPHFGIIGAAICSGVSFALGQGLILNIYYYKVIKLDIPLFWKNIIRMSIVPVFMAIAGYIVVNLMIPWLSIWIMLFEGVIFVLVYITLTWLFTMNSYERSIFTGILKKINISKFIRKRK